MVKYVGGKTTVNVASQTFSPIDGDALRGNSSMVWTPSSPIYDMAPGEPLTKPFIPQTILGSGHDDGHGNVGLDSGNPSSQGE